MCVLRLLRQVAPRSRHIVEVAALRAEIVEEVLRIVVVAVVAHRIAALLRAVAVRHRTAVAAAAHRIRVVEVRTHRTLVVATRVADSFSA